jgi:hypothetical protein
MRGGPGAAAWLNLKMAAESGDERQLATALNTAALYLNSQVRIFSHRMWIISHRMWINSRDNRQQDHRRANPCFDFFVQVGH